MAGKGRRNTAAGGSKQSLSTSSRISSPPPKNAKAGTATTTTVTTDTNSSTSAGSGKELHTNGDKNAVTISAELPTATTATVLSVASEDETPTSASNRPSGGRVSEPAGLDIMGSTVSSEAGAKMDAGKPSLSAGMAMPTGVVGVLPYAKAISRESSPTRKSPSLADSAGGDVTPSKSFSRADSAVPGNDTSGRGETTTLGAADEGSESSVKAVQAGWTNPLPLSMSAWQYSRFGGGPEALELVMDKTIPRAGKGEVVIQVDAIAVNPVDWKIQKGMLRPVLPFKLPYVPGSDVAGVVRELGLGVEGLKIGDRVYGTTNILEGGGYAKYAKVYQFHAAKLPDKVSTEEAACFPVAAGTALQSIRAKVPKLDGSYKGRILVANASGGVGHYAVQLARLAGAHVTATAGARNMEFVKELGAHEVLDYKSEEGRALKSPSGGAYDLIIDGTGSPGLNWGVVQKVLAKGGTWVHLTPPFSVIVLSAWLFLTRAERRCYPLIFRANRADFDLLAELAAAGKLRTVVETRVPFEQTPIAWKRSIEGHVVGKIVIVA